MTELEPEQRKRRIFISGKMTGLPEWGYPAFHVAAAKWRALGWHVENQAEAFGGDTSLPRTVYMKAAIRALLTCDAIALLPNWMDSEGARLEAMVAREAGLEILEA